MSVWLVKPEEIEYPLVFDAPDGSKYPFWIKLKKHLTVGEERAVMTAGWKGLNTGNRRGDAGEIKIDWHEQSFARTAAYLTDWSLEDDAHKRLPVDVDTISALHSAVFTVIEDAITRHVEAMVQEKKVTAGEDSPSAT